MSLDRTPAHLADMLGFVRELRAIAAGRSLEACLADRIHGYERIDQETLYRTAAADLPAVESALAAALTERDRP